MTLEESIKANKPQIVDAFRRMVKAKVEQWDADREIELLIGQEIDGVDDLLENIAVGLDTPDDAGSLNEDEIVKWVTKIATGEEVER